MSKKTATYGMLVALAFLFSYVETLIPLSVGIPGIKLGLANLVVLAALYLCGERSAFVISLVRILLVGLTFTSLSVMFYSLAGGMLSFLCMALGKHFTKLSITGISILGGITHNLGQILLAAAVLKTSALLYYVPALLIAGTLAGLVIGLLGGLLVTRLRPALEQV